MSLVLLQWMFLRYLRVASQAIVTRRAAQLMFVISDMRLPAGAYYMPNFSTFHNQHT